MVVCPLCFNKKSFTMVHGPDARTYRGCNKCRLIFTETRFLPSARDEKKRYLTHKNGIQYPGYVKFLNQAINPALPLLSEDMEGLDFGCGPTPTLSLLLKNQGYKCNNYDPIFFPVLACKHYDFIFATECFEHFFFPEKEIKKIHNLLKPGGLLIIMTETWNSIDAFSNWYYAKDTTHVSFYHNHTFRFIAEKFNFESLDNISQRVILLKKQQVPAEILVEQRKK